VVLSMAAAGCKQHLLPELHPIAIGLQTTIV
jgi:hypothetical protein